ncbi:MAG: hypothetical protein R2715_10445 [Ilumatobacteraceae bacterium]
MDSGEEAAVCFQSYVDSGDLAPSDVPVQLAYPECGLAEAWWSYYDGMTDAEFTATVTAAHDCFQALVDEGALEDWQMPFDVIAPDCYGGTSPYAIDDDDARFEALDEYSTCAFG